jgi:hypothetical protein
MSDAPAQREHVVADDDRAAGIPDGRRPCAVGQAAWMERIELPCHMPSKAVVTDRPGVVPP